MYESYTILLLLLVLVVIWCRAMEIFGIKFAPFNVPLHRRLETLAAAALIFAILFGGPIGTYLLIYLIFYTRYWPIGVLYLVWFIIDINTSERGGRRIEWVRGWSWWRHLINYFPATIKTLPSVELDPNENYIFCAFPHGVLPLGLISAFCSKYSNFKELFPHHTQYAITLRENFFMPILRDLFLALGGCSVSKESLKWLLRSSKGGKVLLMTVGGAAEALECQSGLYKIVLRNRKGFVKLALMHGTPLVPVFTFGENELFHQIANPKGSNLRRIQEFVKNSTGVAPAVFVGRGFFQYSFGIIPFRKPITVVVGKPLNVIKTEQPTQEQINTTHMEFMQSITELFEEQKHKYIPNAEKVSLAII